MASNPESNKEKYQDGAAERAEQSELKNLERAKAPEKKFTKAEKEQGEADLARKHESAEKKLSAEKEKQELELSKEKAKAEKSQEVAPEKKDPNSYTRAQKKAVYKKEMKHVQAQLPKGSRAFSKVIHNSAVEKVSDVAGKTVFRPSALMGGAITGLIFGVLFYMVARYYGYVIPTWMLSILLIAGAIVGVLIEFVISRFHHDTEA